MAETQIEVTEYKCERCEHKWVARGARNLPAAEDGKPSRPRTCPRCKSAWWDIPPRSSSGE